MQPLSDEEHLDLSKKMADAMRAIMPAGWGAVVIAAAMVDMDGKAGLQLVPIAFRMGQAQMETVCAIVGAGTPDAMVKQPFASH